MDTITVYAPNVVLALLAVSVLLPGVVVLGIRGFFTRKGTKYEMEIDREVE